MKKERNGYILTICFFTLFILETAQATSTCPSFYKTDGFYYKSQRSSSRLKALKPNTPTVNQSLIAQFAKINQLPSFTITTAAGASVPVILINKFTLKHWNPLLNASVGLNQSLHPNNANNHGWVRLPGKVTNLDLSMRTNFVYSEHSPASVLIDLFSPLQSGDQALHGTGYRWKVLSEYFARRDQRSYVHIEQVFVLSPKDQEKVWLYHLIRRGALVRIQYMFDTFNNSWIISQRRVLQRDNEFNRRRYCEHCNNSRLGMTALNQAREMRGRMLSLFNKSPEEIWNLPEGRQFLSEAKQKILSKDWRDADDLTPDVLNDDNLIQLLDKHFQNHLSREEQVDAVTYFVATHAFEQMNEVREKFSIEEETAMGLSNPNVSAYLIYSDLPDSETQFKNATFEYLGAGGNGFSASFPGLNPQKNLQ